MGDGWVFGLWGNSCSWVTRIRWTEELKKEKKKREKRSLVWHSAPKSRVLHDNRHYDLLEQASSRRFLLTPQPRASRYCAQIATAESGTTCWQCTATVTRYATKSIRASPCWSRTFLSASFHSQHCNKGGDSPPGNLWDRTVVSALCGTPGTCRPTKLAPGASRAPREGRCIACVVMDGF